MKFSTKVFVFSVNTELKNICLRYGAAAFFDKANDFDKLIETIKGDFDMTIDIEKLIQDIDEDGSGEIEFDEFKLLL